MALTCPRGILGSGYLNPRIQRIAEEVGETGLAVATQKLGRYEYNSWGE